MKRATSILFLINSLIALFIAVLMIFYGAWWAAILLTCLVVFSLLAFRSWSKQETIEWVSDEEATDIPWKQHE